VLLSFLHDISLATRWIVGAMDWKWLHRIYLAGAASNLIMCFFLQKKKLDHVFSFYHFLMVDTSIDLK
jgi:hypothetical protein